MTQSSSTGSSSGLATPNRRRSDLRKYADTEVEIYVSLEELYTGVTKQFRFPSNHFGEERRSKTSNVQDVVIEPGYKAGTKLRFRPETGDTDGVPPGDIVFVVREKEHDIFKRVGHNLEIVHRISLSDAIAGSTITVTGIDGQDYAVNCSDIVNPKTVKRIHGAGMPKSKRPGERGDLMVKFDIVFPRALRQSTRERMRELLRRG